MEFVSDLRCCCQQEERAPQLLLGADTLRAAAEDAPPQQPQDVPGSGQGEVNILARRQPEPPKEDADREPLRSPVCDEEAAHPAVEMLFLPEKIGGHQIVYNCHQEPGAFIIKDLELQSGTNSITWLKSKDWDDKAQDIIRFDTVVRNGVLQDDWFVVPAADERERRRLEEMDTPEKQDKENEPANGEAPKPEEQMQHPEDKIEAMPAKNIEEAEQKGDEQVSVKEGSAEAQDTPKSKKSVQSSSRSTISIAVNSAVTVAKVMANPRNMRRFMVDVLILEVFCKQIPLALVFALPVVLTDTIVRFVVKPARELTYINAAHKAARNASFNVHIAYSPSREEIPGVISNAIFANGCLFTCMTVWFIWNMFVVPFFGLTREQFKACTGKVWIVVVVLFLIMEFAVMYIGGVNASKIEGDHQYAFVGRISPIFPPVLFFATCCFFRGRGIKKATGNNTMWIGLTICLACAIFFPVEVVYLLGNSTMGMKQKEFVVFLYRLFVWPLLWYFGLVPMFRYVLLASPGDPSDLFPFLGFFLVIMSASSRTAMFMVDNNIYFTILSITDAMMQSSFNFHYQGSPIIDQVVLKTIWRRCVKRQQKDKDQMVGTSSQEVFVDESRAKLLRMLWFQAQSVVELTVVFSQTFRNWAYYESRFAFAIAYRPDCNNAGVFNLNDLLIKLAISVATVTAGDLVSSYLVYCRGFPLQEAFHALLTNPKSWMSFALNNWAGFVVLIFIMMPVVGRMGNCENFDNGCSCTGIVLYQEICGCCGLGESAKQAQPYDLCRLETNR